MTNKNTNEKGTQHLGPAAALAGGNGKEAAHAAAAEKEQAGQVSAGEHEAVGGLTGAGWLRQMPAADREAYAQMGMRDPDGWDRLMARWFDSMRAFRQTARVFIDPYTEGQAKAERPGPGGSLNTGQTMPELREAILAGWVCPAENPVARLRVEEHIRQLRHVLRVCQQQEATRLAEEIEAWEGLLTQKDL